MKATHAWRWRSLCDDDETWLSDEPGDQAAAKAICARCPVACECLAAAMAEEGNSSHLARAGVRGGLTPRERWSAHAAHDLAEPV